MLENFNKKNLIKFSIRPPKVFSYFCLICQKQEITSLTPVLPSLRVQDLYQQWGWSFWCFRTPKLFEVTLVLILPCLLELWKFSIFSFISFRVYYISVKKNHSGFTILLVWFQDHKCEKAIELYQNGFKWDKIRIFFIHLKIFVYFYVYSVFQKIIFTLSLEK